MSFTARENRDLLESAALEAGKIALKYWRASPKNWEKPDGLGPVSEADLAINEMLKSRLRSARPDYAWLSEECADESERVKADFTFIIDPIDGTRTFLEGGKTFSISIAIAYKGKIQAAAVHVPAKEQLYLAAQDEGAICNGERLTVSAHSTPNQAKALIRKKHLTADFWHAPVPNMIPNFRSSIAYRLCRLAQ